MIFDYLENHNITNFGYVILFDGKPSLSILNEDHSFINDIIIQDEEGLYTSMSNTEIIVVGVIIKNNEGVIVNSEYLDDYNIEDMMYSLFPLYIYTIKTNGLTVDDLIDLHLMDTLFYDILDNYIKERSG